MGKVPASLKKFQFKKGKKKSSSKAKGKKKKLPAFLRKKK